MRRRSWFSLVTRVLACSSFALLISCGGSEDSDSTAAVSANFDSLWSNVFEVRCAGCHAPGAGNSQTSGGPDLSTKDGFYTAFFNVKGSAYPSWTTFKNNRADCLDKAFIAPSNAGASLLVGIFDPANAPCTVVDHREPPQSVPMTTDTLAALKAWINAGATR